MANIKEIVIVTKESVKTYKLGDSADSTIIRDTQDMNTKLPFNAALYTGVQPTKPTNSTFRNIVP